MDVAVEKFTQLCVEAGYIAADNDETEIDENEVRITVVGLTNQEQTGLNDKN